MDETGGFVPVDRGALEALTQARDALETARSELAVASRALVELAEDMKVDAVRRLAERGASSAQVERYEEAYRTAREALDARARELDAATRRLDEAVRAVVG